jgi:glycosyltransferase involved in cell wall biosynthesis
MRIAFVVYGSLDNVSGGFVYDRALVGGLRSLGHEVDVFGLPWHGWVRAVAGDLFARRRPRPPVPAEARLYDALVQDELIHPSVVFSNRRAGAWPRGRVVLALVHNLRSAQGRGPVGALEARLERRYLHGLNGAVAVCARTRDDVRALAGPALPVEVVYPGRDHVTPGVDDRAVEERARTAGPLRVLHLAAVQRHKGLHRLLDALAWLPDVAVTLDVVGAERSPAYALAVRAQAARLGLEGRVRFHGQRRGAELHAILRESQVLALPSDREAYSLACLEALGYGLPVLATSAGGLGEMITDGREGLLLDPHDRAGWARALRGLAEDRAALTRMGRAALARYGAHPTWRAAAAATEAFVRARF